MRPLGVAAIRAGLVSQDSLDELGKWGLLPRKIDEPIVSSPEQAVILIQEALEAEDQVRLKKTDLDVLKFFLNEKNQKRGRLVIHDPDTGEKASKTVSFCILPGKRYVMPWLSDSALDLLVNDHSYLSHKVTADAKPQRVYFNDVRELYFGDVKAFMVLEAGSVESG